MRLGVTVTGIGSVKSLLVKLSDRAKGVDRKPLMERIADRLAQRIVGNIDAGAGAPLSAATLAIRKSRGITGTKPLVATGELRSKVKAVATDRSAGAEVQKFTASFLQFGVKKTGKGSAIPGKKVPARPFALLNPLDVTWAQDQLAAWVVGVELGDEP